MNINFESLRNDSLKDILTALEAALEELQIDYYLIGALARDTWFVQEKKISRTTADVDFAIYVPEEKKFQALKKFLRDKWKFTQSIENSFAMISTSGMIIDILPFGAVDFTGDVKIGGVVTNGFMEVYNKALQTVVANDHFEFKVPTLPAIILLKIIAFQDRPEMRLKDPQDIYEIIIHYFDLQSEIIYEKHADLFDHEQELLLISSRAIGREIAEIVSNNIVLKDRIYRFLESEIKNFEKSIFIRSMGYTNKYNPDQLRKWIQEILRGLVD